MYFRYLLCFCLTLASTASVAALSGPHSQQIKALFPLAEHTGGYRGEPPAAPVYQGGELLGYVFQTQDIAPVPAYSGRPINVLVGIDTGGDIQGAFILSHDEPILVVGIKEQALDDFVAQYRHKSATDKIRIGAGKREGYVHIDGISGATITVMVLNETIMRSARQVYQSRQTAQAATPSVTTTAGNTHAAGQAPITGQHEPIWLSVWRESLFAITVLSAGLLLLTMVLIFQDWLTRRPRLLFYLRTGFLLYTVFFIGWYALAQLSVINVLTFSSAIMRDFSWDTFLIDPMIFLLWAFVAMTLLLWGRGVYCGWLCPFGALQELLNKLAHYWKIPQFDFPFSVHERLWAIKYLILLGLFGVSLQSLPTAERIAEIEPFKTAITLRFQREWGFIVYALALLLISLFNRKFFCRYLCPLGAALAIPARIRLFDWLKRHSECGRPCQVCANECEVQAIHPGGAINPNECHYCLDCQVTYFNEYRCPPMVARRKRRERAPAARQSVKRIEEALRAKSGLDDMD